METNSTYRFLVALAGAAILFVVVRTVLRRFRREFVVYEYERGVLFKNGMLNEVLQGGYHVRWGKNLALTSLDLRPQWVPVSNQEVLTSDGLAIRVTANLRYSIQDPARAILSSESYFEHAYAAVHIALRDAVTALTAEELLRSRRELSPGLTEAARPQFEALGLSLEGVEIRDITFPGELRQSMAQVALARKAAEAALERARGESAALRSLANAAKVLEGNPALMQLRILQSLAEAKDATIVLNTSPSDALPVKA